MLKKAFVQLSKKIPEQLLYFKKTPRQIQITFSHNNFYLTKMKIVFQLHFYSGQIKS